MITAYIHTYNEIIYVYCTYIHTYAPSYLHTEIYQRVVNTSKINEFHQTVEIIKSMQPPIHTLEDLYDSYGNFSITLCKYESMDINVCMYSLDYMVR